MSIPPIIENTASSKFVPVAGTGVPAKLPEPTVSGNESIEILKHRLSYRTGSPRRPRPCVVFTIRNISDITISNLVFEATFFDRDGNIVDVVNHNEIEFKPSTSRVVVINCSDAVHQPRSYQVRISRMTNPDQERVQLREHRIKTTGSGEEISGIVKNISCRRTDTALVANFYNPKKEKIGTKVILMRGIEADSYKQFHFTFGTMKGEIVMTYSLNVVSEIEEC